jgi:hypothetical protein
VYGGATPVTRLLICLAVALFGALLGPKLVAPSSSRRAGAPFEYEPPEDFVVVSSDVDGAKAWVFEDPATLSMNAKKERVALVRVVLHHSEKEMSVEEADLAKLASQMGSAFESACTWTHRRHELRTRADGARVGLIEGDCDRDVDMGPHVFVGTGQAGASTQKLRSRKLQLMFPDDTGTWIATASYPTDQAARWEPLFEATIGKARGVAVRAPSQPAWMHFAAGFAAFILAWFASALVVKKRA